MKKLSIIGSALGASLLQILARDGWETAGRSVTQAQARRQRKTLPTGRFLYLSAPRPTDARHWHKPADPHQAARIEAAAAKRERKAAVADVNYLRSQAYNTAHHVTADLSHIY